MEGLVDALARSVTAGQPVAPGLECPLWVPMAASPAALTSARMGEGSRPWSAGAGSGVLATGLVQATWLLGALRKLLPGAQLFLDWGKFSTAAGPKILVWEAFVTSAGKGLPESPCRRPDCGEGVCGLDARPARQRDRQAGGRRALAHRASDPANRLVVRPAPSWRAHAGTRPEFCQEACGVRLRLPA